MPVGIPKTVGSGTTLFDVRQLLVRRSGNYSLVVDAANEDWTDNGANAFINAGQRWMDRKFAYDKQQSWYTHILAADQSLLSFDKARYIESVEISTEDGGRKILARKTLRDLMTEFSDVPLSSITGAEPKFWTPDIVGLSPELFSTTLSSLTSDGVVDTDFYLYGDHYLTSAVIILPPPDVAYTVKVLGRWLSKELTSDNDVSVWTVNAPELLVRAARLQIETDLHRGSEGSNVFEARLLDDLNEFYRDFKAEAVAGPPSDWIMNG